VQFRTVTGIIRSIRQRALQRRTHIPRFSCLKLALIEICPIIAASLACGKAVEKEQLPEW
jgi:hypothetical protein